MSNLPLQSEIRMVRSALILRAVAVLVFALWISSVQAEGLSRHHHSWGRFQPGAWNLLRETTETFEDSGTTVSISERRTSLREVHDDGVTLAIQGAIDLPGKQFSTNPSVVKQAFHGGLASQEATVTDLGDAEVTVEGRKIPCRIEQVVVSTKTGKTTTKIYYSDSVEPYILRRESVRTAPDGKEVLSETIVEVVDLGVPCRIISGLSRATHVKATHKRAGMTTERISVFSTAVPGGIVCQTSKELDENDHLVGRTTLTLVDWGLRPEVERQGLFRRRIGRERRSIKVTPYGFQSSERD